MATEFKLPELGENIESGDLVRLLIKPGASIAEGEPVMELETDKAVVEVPSSVTGTIGEVRVKEGDKLRVGQVIFTVEQAAEQAKAASAGVPSARSSASSETVSSQKPSVAPAKTSISPPSGPAPSAPSSQASASSAGVDAVLKFGTG